MANLEETCSVNHNWINEFSIWNSWGHLLDELKLVEEEIEYLHKGMVRVLNIYLFRPH